MGTEFQHTINPLAENRKNITFGIRELDDWDYLKPQKGDKQKSSVFINFEDSMDKLLEKEKVEFIKRTMMTQESIFKHQVRELHQLYNTQKLLMNENRNEIKEESRNITPFASGNKPHHIGRLIEDHISMKKGIDLKRSVTDESGQLSTQSSRIAKLSVWGGSDNSTMNRAVDEEDHRLTQRVHKPSIHISMENNSNTCNKDGDGYEECDIELTLGIGGKKKQMKTEGSSSSNHKQSNLPHWLYKSLGSNKT